MDSIMHWRFEGEPWVPSPEGDEEADAAEAAASSLSPGHSDDSIPIGSDVKMAVERVIDMTLGQTLQAHLGQMSGLPLATQHVVADRVARAREVFAAELTTVAEAKQTTDGLISEEDIKGVLDKVAPKLRQAGVM